MAYKLIEEPETIPERALRTGTRGIARAAETALGLPGDIGSLLTRGLGKAEEFMYQRQREAGTPWAEDVPEEPYLSRAAEYMPTTEKVREKVTEPLAEKYLPKGYLEPKSEAGKSFDTGVEFLTSLLMPAGLLGKAAKLSQPMKLGRALKIAVPASFASYLTKRIGYGKKAQEGVRIGTAMLASFGNPLALKRFGKQMWPTQKEIFLEELQKASKIHSFLNKLPVIRYFKKQNISAVTQGLIGAGYGLLKKSPVAKFGGLAVAGGYGLGHMEKVVRMLIKNPNLRKAYANTFKAAINESKGGLFKSVINLDKLVRKENIIEEFPEIIAGAPKNKKARFKLILD